MDLLIAETLEPEVVSWLESRHSVRYAPQLAQRPARRSARGCATCVR